MLSGHLAQAHLTERLRFGSGFNVTLMWHLHRLAEDFATADILTGGRVIFGVGRGYHTREVEVFGAPLLDQDANRELLMVRQRGDARLHAFARQARVEVEGARRTRARAGVRAQPCWRAACRHRPPGLDDRGGFRQPGPDLLGEELQRGQGVLERQAVGPEAEGVGADRNRPGQGHQVFLEGLQPGPRAADQ